MTLEGMDGMDHGNGNGSDDTSSSSSNSHRNSGAPVDHAAYELASGFARQVAHWALAPAPGRAVAPQAVALVRQAALALSLATSEGHVCIDLAEAVADTPGDALDRQAVRTTLLASGLVGTPAAPHAMPMILDGEGRLYLHRYFDYERRLARRLVQAAAEPVEQVVNQVVDQAAHQHVNRWASLAATRALLAELFPRHADDARSAGHAGHADHNPAVDWQQAAAALALRSRLLIISGGPGTGKTTTVVKLLACLLAQQPDARIALTAPTGKAAARMSQAVRERAALLPLSDALRARLPGHASTVHRLLGVTPGPGGFVHHAGNPLAIDVLVVDEASMLDLALATRLLEAVPPHARIVLLGDKDQLSAVESGSVFAEISANASLSAACATDLEALCGLAPGSIQPPAGVVPDAPSAAYAPSAANAADAAEAPSAAEAPHARHRPHAPGALQDTVVWFKQNFRFGADSGIGRLAADANAGRAGQALQTLRHAARPDAPDDSVQWLADASPRPGAAVWQQLLAGYAPFIDVLRRNPRDVAAVTLAFNRFRALCAVREGPRGTLAVNAHAAQAVRSVLGDSAPNMQNEWYVGRPVMVLRNDAVLKLFNGDVGLALPDASGALMVHFATTDRTGWRAIPPLRMPTHQTAFAMTVHKAQGSEFDTVLVVLPQRRSRVVTRELLYTAITRARQSVVLCAGADVITAAIQSPTQRRSGLLARLDEAAESLAC